MFPVRLRNYSVLPLGAGGGLLQPAPRGTPGSCHPGDSVEGSGGPLVSRLIPRSDHRTQPNWCPTPRNWTRAVLPLPRCPMAVLTNSDPGLQQQRPYSLSSEASSKHGAVGRPGSRRRWGPPRPSLLPRGWLPAPAALFTRRLPAVAHGLRLWVSVSNLPFHADTSRIGFGATLSLSLMLSAKTRGHTQGFWRPGDGHLFWGDTI